MKDMAKITYETKEALNENADILDKYKCNASDLNEIKEVVNTNDDNSTANTESIGTLSNLSTTAKTDLVSAINEAYQNNVYSTSETIVGKWINGKSIYRKVIDFGALPNKTKKQVYHNISNIDIFTKIYGVASTDGGVYFYPLPLVYRSTDSAYNVEVLVTKTYVAMSTTQDRSAITAYVVLEYTKTS